MSGGACIGPIGLICFFFLVPIIVSERLTVGRRVALVATGMLGVFSAFFTVLLVIAMSRGSPIRPPGTPAPTFIGTVTTMFTTPGYVVGLVVALAMWAAAAWCIVRGLIGPPRCGD